VRRVPEPRDLRWSSSQGLFEGLGLCLRHQAALSRPRLNPAPPPRARTPASAGRPFAPIEHVSGLGNGVVDHDDRAAIPMPSGPAAIGPRPVSVYSRRVRPAESRYDTTLGLPRDAIAVGKRLRHLGDRRGECGNPVIGAWCRPISSMKAVRAPIPGLAEEADHLRDSRRRSGCRQHRAQHGGRERSSRF
jgi:hypothetical protein